MSNMPFSSRPDAGKDAVACKEQKQNGSQKQAVAVRGGRALGQRVRSVTDREGEEPPNRIARCRLPIRNARFGFFKRKKEGKDSC
ncbi:hypothetical protein [Rhizobium sp. RSm-3]|uniref:hypothetical protein n=1 Tax=Rhizobium sp. RSm-3 TaxID=1720346 RepID=UPI0010427893|nr:hypothetical protein [Rhizobium sp. RSm-3]